VTGSTPVLNVTEALAALRERHGLDWDTAAAIAFERSRQHNVSLAQALTDFVAELDAKNSVAALVAARQSQPPDARVVIY